MDNKFENKSNQEKNIVNKIGDSKKSTEPKPGNKISSEAKSQESPSLQQLIEQSRGLMSQYAQSFQSELVHGLDSMFDSATTSLQGFLERNKGMVNDFIRQTGDAVSQTVQKIDRRPLISWSVIFLGGCALGIFLGRNVRKSGHIGRTTDKIDEKLSNKAA